MKKIKELIFGRVNSPVDTISTGVHTVHPKDEMTFQQWLRQYRVSMLYDRKAIEIGNPLINNKTKQNDNKS